MLKTKKKVLVRYLPFSLSRKDKRRQMSMLLKSQKMYKRGKYISRPPVKSFHSKPSNHIQKAKKMYHLNSIVANQELARKTGCTKQSLQKIVTKGKGAYFSSGSRPNQTAESWGIARLASAITGGKAAAVDYSILENGCRATSLALKLANRARNKYKKKTRKMPKRY